MTVTNEEMAKPWYREFWAWFILAPLIATVILSSIMVTTAVKYGDDEITDNYYKKGRMINQSLEQVEWARDHGIEALTKFDLELGDLNVRLTSGDRNYALPEQMTLFLDHPLDERLDREILLKEFAPGHYRADLEARLHHRWYMRLVPGDGAVANASDDLDQHIDPEHPWRLNGEINFNSHSDILLKAP